MYMRRVNPPWLLRRSEGARPCPAICGAGGSPPYPHSSLQSCGRWCAELQQHGHAAH